MTRASARPRPHRPALLPRLALCLSVGLVACDPPGATDAGVDSGPAEDAATLPTTLGPAERPARLVVPPAHDGTTPLPVLVLLHGYSADAAAQDLYFGMSREAQRRGFYLVLPDGTRDGRDNRFWNATPACCDFGDLGVDDAGYLLGLLDELETLAPVAAGQVFFMGHSNGGFMSYRMACEASDRIAAIASLAGSDFLGDTECVPGQPVSVLQIHGDADGTVLYEGGSTVLIGTETHPSAPDVVARWAARGGCDTATTTDGAPLDLDPSIAGAETLVTRYETGCTSASAELWTIQGGTHIPVFDPSATGHILDWLFAHGR